MTPLIYYFLNPFQHLTDVISSILIFFASCSHYFQQRSYRSSLGILIWSENVLICKYLFVSHTGKRRLKILQRKQRPRTLRRTLIKNPITEALRKVLSLRTLEMTLSIKILTTTIKRTVSAAALLIYKLIIKWVWHEIHTVMV